MTDSEKYYNLRDMRVISPIKGQEKFNGWFGKRKNGRVYLKQFRKNCVVYQGGEGLNEYLEKNKDIKAYEVNKWEPV